ncbi:thermonuclease family protein [Candidatus Microgenomates bacterium]|nr:thermonuclease family protein [Candidatus Microgenomates bacterium]
MNQITRQPLGLTSRRKKILFALSVAVLLSLGGAGYATNDRLANYLQQNQPGSHSVIEVNDGDTITVNINGKAERVRLIGIDTPELHHPEKPVQCFAEAARGFASNLINGNRVRLEADPEDDNRDLYGRLLRYVYLPDGTLLNAEIIKQGYGFAYTHFPFVKLEEFRTYETQAREQALGLWTSCTIEQTETGPETNPL